MSKLGFVVRLLKKGDDDLGGSVVLALCNDFGESCLFRECRELEDVFGTNFTGQILSECIGDVRQIKAAIIKVDKEQRISHYVELHTLCMRENVHIMNTDVPAGVGAPPLDTQLLVCCTGSAVCLAVQHVTKS